MAIISVVFDVAFRYQLIIWMGWYHCVKLGCLLSCFALFSFFQLCLIAVANYHLMHSDNNLCNFIKHIIFRNKRHKDLQTFAKRTNKPPHFREWTYAPHQLIFILKSTFLSDLIATFNKKLSIEGMKITVHFKTIEIIHARVKVNRWGCVYPFWRWRGAFVL